MLKAIGWAMDVFGGRTSGRVEDDNVLWEAETIANLPALGVPLSRYLACRRDAFFLVALIWQACGKWSPHALLATDWPIM